MGETSIPNLKRVVFLHPTNNSPSPVSQTYCKGHLQLLAIRLNQHKDMHWPNSARTASGEGKFVPTKQATTGSWRKWWKGRTEIGRDILGLVEGGMEGRSGSEAGNWPQQHRLYSKPQHDECYMGCLDLCP